VLLRREQQSAALMLDARRDCREAGRLQGGHREHYLYALGDYTEVDYERVLGS